MLDLPLLRKIVAHAMKRDQESRLQRRKSFVAAQAGAGLIPPSGWLQGARERIYTRADELLGDVEWFTLHALWLNAGPRGLNEHLLKEWCRTRAIEQALLEEVNEWNKSSQVSLQDRVRLPGGAEPPSQEAQARGQEALEAEIHHREAETPKEVLTPDGRPTGSGDLSGGGSDLGGLHRGGRVGTGKRTGGGTPPHPHRGDTGSPG